MANTYISRTQANGTSSQKFTVSCWVKRSQVGSSGALWGSGSSTTDGCDLFIQTNGELGFESWDTSVNPKVITTRKLVDPLAWYHIVLAVDTTQGTASNRLKMYINGVQETLFGIAETYPPEDYNFMVSTTNDIMKFGVGGQYATSYFNGSMSYVAFIDGTAELPTVFGETDATTGQWKIKTSITPSVAWGTNGCLLLKDGNSLTDASPNSNNFTLAGGTLTNTEDSPSNVFATMNPLDNYYTVHSFANGNTTVIAPSSGYSGVIGAMGASTGKYYFEFKPVSKTGDADEYSVGIVAETVKFPNQPQWKMATGYMYTGVNGNKINNDTSTSYGNTFTAGDIVGVAMDLDNLKIYFSKNGTWQTSGDPTSGATGTGAAFTLTAPSSTEIGSYLPCCAFVSNSAGATMAFNFGNGYFQTTAVASAGTNASGNGIFEYDVPTGYTALSTKGLNL